MISEKMVLKDAGLRSIESDSMVSAQNGSNHSQFITAMWKFIGLKGQHCFGLSSSC